MATSNMVGGESLEETHSPSADLISQQMHRSLRGQLIVPDRLTHPMGKIVYSSTSGSFPYAKLYHHFSIDHSVN